VGTSERFDAAYYGRFYGRRPVHDRRRIALLANGVTSLAAWWRIPIRSVLDVGAGKGYWRDHLAAEHPRVHYHGLDISAHASARYGHEHADISTWTPPRAYDLVICQSVLQYLDDDAVRRSITVLGAACRGLLLVEAPTTADRSEVIDPERTDLDIEWRSGDWYRALLDHAFLEIGAGLWASRRLPIPFFELERSRRPGRVTSRVIEA
jgi:trans-aconitate methyltransferase